MALALTDFDPATLAQQFSQWGCKPAQAGELLRQFYLSGGVVNWPKLRLGRVLEGQIHQHIPLRQSTILARTQSSDGTIKLLLGLTGGGEGVECVLMPGYDPVRAAGCVSCQIGCAMGCDFCASTRDGVVRSLTAGEIVEQFLHLRQLAMSINRRLATLVFMGMGEPMLNLDQVILAIGRIARPGMGDLGGRQITVSTVGVIPGIDRLAEADMNVHLAVSLHAPDDATRQRIVPSAKAFSVVQIMAAARRFQERTGRVVNIEYCLLDGVNDSPDHAAALADLMAGFRAHVNLITYNSIGAGRSGNCYQAPPPPRAEQFLTILRQRGVVAHARRARGDDVSAACGQLRRAWLAKPASSADGD